MLPTASLPWMPHNFLHHTLSSLTMKSHADLHMRPFPSRGTYRTQPNTMQRPQGGPYHRSVAPLNTYLVLEAKLSPLLQSPTPSPLALATSKSARFPARFALELAAYLPTALIQLCHVTSARLYYTYLKAVEEASSLSTPQPPSPHYTDFHIMTLHPTHRQRANAQNAASKATQSVRARRHPRLTNVAPARKRGTPRRLA